MLSRVVCRVGVGVGLMCAMGVSAQPDYAGSDSIFAPIPWPSHGEVRLGSGAPGPDYWQQRADYEIDVTLDVENTRLIGSRASVSLGQSRSERVQSGFDRNAVDDAGFVVARAVGL